MNVLVTCSGSDHGQSIATGLKVHTVRLTDRTAGAGGSDVIVCDLGHDEATDRLCNGIDAIVLVNASNELTDSEVIDAHSRQIYNLLTAAVEAGVKHVVMISSLSLFDAVDPAYAVDEAWGPTVTTDPDVLRHHVAEFVCREFARAGALDVTCLRVGSTVESDPGESEATVSALVDAVNASLKKCGSGWSVYHLVSAGDRFSTKRVEEALNVEPRRSA